MTGSRVWQFISPCTVNPTEKSSRGFVEDRPVVVVVGAKVPSDVFQHAQYNVAVGNQPHSEVVALALFMEGWFGQGGSERHFPDAKLTIEPSARGKSVIDRDRNQESD